MDGSEFFEKMLANLERVVRGKKEVLEQLLVAILAGGNVLLEDVPGVGKTTLAKTLARTIGGDFKRVQFTPDLLPTDILGSSIYNPKEGSFDFKRGPVFANILLADEVNRASPRTQSSLLEAMSERQVTIEGVSYPLPEPFLVLATQNPVEFHGTYPLPEAQLDRFAMKLAMGYPSLEDELSVLEGQRRAHPLDSLEVAAKLEEVIEAQAAVREVKVAPEVSRYILGLVHATREEPRLKLGSSPRGALALYRSSQARAFTQGRDYVLPDDVKALAMAVLAHRLVLDTKSKYSGVSKATITQELLEKVPVTA
ncbi:MAG: AAA family ATPase [Vulcanimicrobiota bacterium]